jgi:ADP-ribose pyrophosphatase YjhB (NUDIX family)
MSHPHRHDADDAHQHDADDAHRHDAPYAPDAHRHHHGQAAPPSGPAHGSMPHVHGTHHPAAWRHGVEQIRHCQLCGGALQWTYVAEQRAEHKVCTGCGRIQWFNPKVAAGTLILSGGGVVLLRRGIEPGHGLWTYPGGFVNLGETAQEAAVRETSEESGLHVELDGPAGVYTSDARDIIIVVFRARVVGGSLSACDECLDARVFQPNEIPWDQLAFSSTLALMRQTFPEHAPHDEVKSEK